MRRRDREMDEAFAYYVLNKAEYATLSMVDKDNMPYAVALSMVLMDNKLYFHSAKCGKKTEILNYNNKVHIMAVVDTKIVSEKFTTEFASVSAMGTAKEIIEDVQKIKVLEALCQKYTPENMKNFDAAIKRSLKVTAIWEIELDAIASKRKKYDENGIELKQQLD